MKAAAVLAAVNALLVIACQRDPAPQPAASSAGSSSTPSPSAGPTAAASPSSSSAETEKPAQGIELVKSAKIAKLAGEANGRYVAELERTPPARAMLTIATKDAPLLPRARGAYFAIAERIAPGVVAPTALRALRVEEIAEPADPPTRTKLKKAARILANGSVEVALTLAPAPGLERVDLANVLEGQRAWKWEYQLASRDPIPDADRIALALYQQLLAVDYVAGNLNRRFVHRHPKSGRITAAEDNEAFSAKARDETVHDTFDRLSRHVTFSKALRDGLKKLDRDSLEASLRWGDPPTLLVTPKQVEEAVERAQSLTKIIEGRIKHRTEDAVLALP